MKLVDRANLSPETYAAAAASLILLRTLQQVTEWGRRQTPPVLLIEAIAMDEYTHDVIAPWRDGLVLVFGAT